MKKFLISASALTLGMALSGAALASAESTASTYSGNANSAASHEGDNTWNVNASANLASTSAVNVSNTNSKTLSDTSVKNSSSTSVDNRSSTKDSGNTFNGSFTSTKNVSSDRSSDSVSVKNSNNESVNAKDSYNVSNSSKTNESNTQVNANAALSLQVMSNTVTGVAVLFGAGTGGNGGSGAAGAEGGAGVSNAQFNVSTGPVSSSGANDFSGIQTANQDSGFGTATQGVTGLAATSSISFTDGSN